MSHEDLIQKGNRLSKVIANQQSEFACIIQPALTKENTLEVVLSGANNLMDDVDMNNAALLWDMIEDTLSRHNKRAAAGGYAEKRVVYRNNPEHFGTGENERCIHLATDIWMAAGTPLFTPLNATVHSFADNAGQANYGPTIVLQHELEGITFYSLYGHLGRDSLKGLAVGAHFNKGEPFATIGAPHENGNWPPHVHYQYMADMMDQKGDFIGVATVKEAAFYLALCPKPVLY